MGTTGDIEPYSVSTPDGYVGIDVDLSRDLGRELGRPVEFVPTTWTTLVRDATAHRFDLAMSGIMVLPDRSMFADFSRPYDEATHLAVVRCEDRDRLTTVEDLDRPNVTVFVRTGAASARSALTRLPRARVRQIDEIDGAYQRIANREGDVLVAMGFRVRRHPGLCLGLEGKPFSTAPVAALLPQNSSLLVAVNGWLAKRLEDGTVETVIQSHHASVTSVETVAEP